MSFTFEQLRAAAVEVIRGRAPQSPGLEFNNFDELTIGVSLVLERDGLHVRGPLSHYAADALPMEDIKKLRKVYGELKEQGFIQNENEFGRFTVALVPSPFDLKWIFAGDLGGGGQGVTRKVDSISGAQIGVLKVPQSLTTVARERFRREVEILTGIDHVAVVKLLDFNIDETRGALGYVTPFGVPLDKYWSEQSQGLSPKERYDVAYMFLRQLSEGLALLHEKDVVHRDIKPENVIILDGRAVLIDFGVAFRPEDRRLSVDDGRVVANDFGTPPAAFYGLQDVHPSWDCLGLGWLYGYLVGGVPKPKHFHWRFHPLVEESRRDRAKALLAVCSHESTIPSDAAKFLAQMDRFRLNANELPLQSNEASSLGSAEEAYADVLARDATRNAEETEMLEICIQLFAKPLSDLRATIFQRCVGSQKLPVIQGEPLDLYQGPISPNRPMDGIMREAYRNATFGANTEGRVCLFNCSCGGTEKNFKIRVNLEFIRHHVGDGFRFRLHLWCGLDYKPRTIWADAVYFLHKDGTFRELESDRVESADAIASLAYGWISDPRFWSNLT